MDIHSTLKAFSDENRLRIFNLIWDHSLCVCQMEDILGMKQANISRHIAKLKDAGLIDFRKDGLYIYYFVPDRVRESYPFIGEIITELRRSESITLELSAIQYAIQCKPK